VFIPSSAAAMRPASASDALRNVNYRKAKKLMKAAKKLMKAWEQETERLVDNEAPPEP